MKGLLLLNGIAPIKIDCSGKYDLIVCTDGTYALSRKLGIKVDCVVGDFDSEERPCDKEIEIVVFKPEKNSTDGELALDLLIARGCTEIDIFGGFGKRSDHFMGNLALLKRAAKHKVFGRLIGNEESAYYVNDSIVLDTSEYKTFSIVPFSASVHILSLEGAKYSADNLVINNDQTIGISNVALTNKVVLRLASGEALVFLSKGD